MLTGDGMAPCRPLYLLVGVAMYRMLEAWEAVDTLYFLMSVLSFAGSACNLVPSSVASQLFTCGYGPLGAALFLSALLDPVRWMLDRFAACAIRAGLTLRHAALAFCACLPLYKPTIWLHGCVPRRYRRLRNAPTGADGLSDAWMRAPLTQVGLEPGVINVHEFTAAVLGPLVLALLGAVIMYALHLAESSVGDGGSADGGSGDGGSGDGGSGDGGSGDTGSSAGDGGAVSGGGDALYWAITTIMTGGQHGLCQSTWVRRPRLSLNTFMTLKHTQ